jgi:vacuolar-type H+-ATPase subunit I/STV1
VAIAKMQKLSVIGLSREKVALIEDLMRLGVVQINAQESKLSDEKWNEIVVKDDAEKWVSKWESELEKIDSALAILAQYSEKKKPLIKERKKISEAEFETTVGYEYEIRRKMLKLTKLSRKFSAATTKENKDSTTIMSLMPWKGYDVPAENYKTESTQVWQGLLPTTNDSADFLKILEEKTNYAEAEVVFSDHEQHYISIVFYAPAADEVQTVLRDLGFNRIELPLAKGSVQAAIEVLEKDLADIKAEKQDIADRVKANELLKTKLEEQKTLMLENVKNLHKTADLLIEREKIDSDEFEAIFTGKTAVKKAITKVSVKKAVLVKPEDTKKIVKKTVKKVSQDTKTVKVIKAVKTEKKDKKEKK